MKSQIHRAMFRLETKRRYVVFLGGATIALVGIFALVNSMRFESSYAAGTVCNSNAMKISDAVCLQDMNNYVKQSMEVGIEYELVDKRDDNIYRVARLADDNVWLLDNLRIGGESEMLLTAEDTNTDPELDGGEFILPASGGGENSYTEPVIYIGDKDEVVSEEEDWTVGGYYNYCAASAGTYCDEDNAAIGDAMYDICPAGWRMPTGGDDGEYQAVVSMYTDAIDALDLPLSGRFYDGASGHIGEEGFFWSSTNRDGRRMYYLSRNGSLLSPTGSYRRDRGYSMRCVAKDIEPEFSCNQAAESIDEAVCMQDMNAAVKESMQMDERYILIDSRDGEAYTVAKLLDDNVWLLDNLRLGEESEILLTTEDTNTNPTLNNGEFVLPANGNWGDTYDSPMIDTSNKETIQSAQDGWKIGVHYNYCAASAGTYCESEEEGDLEYDICPAGWRMPTGGNGGEYQAISELYDDVIGAMRLPLSGRFYGGVSGRIGEDGYFWSSTNRDNVRMYYLARNGSTVAPAGSYNRDRGYSIRCVVNLKEDSAGDYQWENDKNEHVLGSEDGLVLLINYPSTAVASVSVGDRRLTTDEYEILGENDTRIVLNAQFINSLVAGDYQLIVGYENGTTIEAQFIIKEESSNPDDDIVVPDTGLISKETGSGGTNLIVLPMIVGVLTKVVFGFVLTRKTFKR